MTEIKRLREIESEDLIQFWDHGDTPEDEVEAIYKVIGERAANAGMSLTEYVKAVQDGDDPAQNVPKVRWAENGTDDPVGPECSAYLKRPDVLKEIGLSYRMVETVLRRLVKDNPAIYDLSLDDSDVLNRVRDIWRVRYGQTKKSRKRT